MEILYYPNFIPADQYDFLLSKADVILGNLRVQLNPYQKYGYTKETGTAYNMIRAAKPGILPVGYPLETQWEPCCLTFKDYDALPAMLLDLRYNAFLLSQLKANAHAMASQYAPEQLYERLN
ncbi:MAG: hypothetical protein H7Z75_03235 [Ferruginibacter sp.]|nr:hypothetical protein [Cytophagales bacterium]